MKPLLDLSSVVVSEVVVGGLGEDRLDRPIIQNGVRTKSAVPFRVALG